MESILPPPDSLPGKVIEAYSGEYESVDHDDYEVLDTGFYHIKTDKGDMTIELRVSHNGYYGGSLDFQDFVPQEEILQKKRDTLQVMSDMILEKNWERVELLLKEIKKLDGDTPPNDQN